MNFENEKIIQRRNIEEIRLAIKKEELIESDRAIYKNFMSMEALKWADVIFCFVSLTREIDTTPIITELLNCGKTVGVPKCISGNTMEVYEIKSLNDLESGFYGIYEPKKSCRLISPQEIDLAIIPCTSCDVKGNRLGKGGGYYDRYLFGQTFKKVALCREKLLSDKIVMGIHDIKMDLVVTENNIYKT
ncbi:MAG: 5-formyltetrahydrofolate cyclo-ligase [Proteocatella sp.]